MTAVQEKMTLARRVAQEIALDDAVDAVLIGGSLTAGLGNEQSDIDLFVVGRPPAGRPRVEQRVMGGHRVDVEWHDPHELQKTFASLAGLELRRENLGDLFSLDDDLDLVSRFCTGEAAYDSGPLVRLTTEVESGATPFQVLLCARWALGFTSGLEDFRGAAAEGDAETAALHGQGLMIAAMKALTAAAGDLYFGRKWAFKQLRRSVQNTDFFHDCWVAQSGLWRDVPELRPEDVIRFATGVVSFAQLLVQRPEPEALWGHLPRLVETASFDRPAGTSLFSLGRHKFLLHEERGRQFTVPTDVAAVWASSVSGSRADVLRRSAALADISVERGGQVLDALLAKGLIRSGRESVRHD